MLIDSVRAMNRSESDAVDSPQNDDWSGVEYFGRYVTFMCLICFDYNQKAPAISARPG